MTTALARAYRLYSQYKTQGVEYRAIAAQLGYTVGDLNARMSGITYDRIRSGRVAPHAGRTI